MRGVVHEMNKVVVFQLLSELKRVNRCGMMTKRSAFISMIDSMWLLSPVSSTKGTRPHHLLRVSACCFCFGGMRPDPRSMMGWGAINGLSMTQYRLSIGF